MSVAVNELESPKGPRIEHPVTVEQFWRFAAEHPDLRLEREPNGDIVLIDPRRKVVEVYRPDSDPEVLHDPSHMHGEGPIAGFVLELARIWN